MVRLEGYGGRKPVQLSGGQRQRVALARSIVNRPKVLLLDEPLGALDLKLRQEMQVFLKALQRDLGMTFIYVTHDQEEALTMSDHVAVFNEGRIEQVGSRPRSTSSPRPSSSPASSARRTSSSATGAASACGRSGSSMNGTGEPATVADVVFVGAFTRYLVDTDAGERLTVVRQNDGTAARAGHARPRRLARRGRIRDQAANPPAGGQMTKRMWALLAAVRGRMLAFPAAGVVEADGPAR